MHMCRVSLPWGPCLRNNDDVTGALVAHLAEHVAHEQGLKEVME